MSFLDKLKSRKNDVQTLSNLMESSIDHAAAAGSTIAGAHHLALAAFEMEDTTAADALAALGKTPEDFRSALSQLDDEALADLGITAPETEPEPVKRTRLGKTDATYEAALQATFELHGKAKDRPDLTSAHVLAGVANVELGISARVFAAMNLERAAVIEACLEGLTLLSR